MADISRIVGDIENVGSRFAVVGLELNFTCPLVERLASGEISLAQAADEILEEASRYGRAAGALARLGGRVKGSAKRMAALKGEAG